ncbi:MAG TPA: hypothetical protein VE713_09255 [Pyrinomonadaceae bacterium]|nr:hypothetical protein [Pyrinomonadaceae bacterium]
MTAKKNTTTKKTTRRRPSIKERSRQIVADAGRYDKDTREAISNALVGERDADLAALVERAEAGEMILDVAAAEKLAGRNALAVKRIFDEEHLPDFLTNALMVALEKASEITGIPYWGDADFDLKGLALLLAATRPVQFEEKVTLEPVRDLDEQISAVLRDERTPEKIRAGILNAMTLYDEDVTDPAYIRLIIAAAHSPEEGGE